MFVSHWFGQTLSSLRAMLPLKTKRPKLLPLQLKYIYAFHCVLHVFFFLPACRTQPSEKRVEVNVNKTSNRQCCTALLMESNDGEVLSSFYSTTCLGCLKRHVSSERPPRAGSFSASPVQIIHSLQGICAAINSLMIFFYSEWVGDLMLNPSLLLHRDSHNVLLTHRKLRIGPLMPNIDSLQGL